MAWQFAGSLVAVAFLVILAWRLGFDGAPQLEGEAHARSFAHDVPGGFDPVDIAMDRSGHAALLRDAAGRLVLVAPAGAHFVARPLPPDTTVASEAGRLVVSASGVSVSLELGQAADDWEQAIAALY